MTVVCKFGGSSLSSRKGIESLVSIVRENKNRRFIVVSAMGRRCACEKKVTDLLFEYAEGNIAVWKEIRQRHVSLCGELGLDARDILDETEYIISQKDTSKEFIVSRGEYLMARIISRLLGFPFVDGGDITGFDQEGRWELEGSLKRASITLSGMQNGVVAGFYGRDEKGRTRLLSRGGSDVTGAVVAYAVNACLYENWTDVDGFMAVSPAFYDGAEIIRSLSYSEMSELSYYGAEVLHHQTVLPLKFRAVPLVIKNTFNSKGAGTVVSYHKNGGVKGMAVKDYVFFDVETTDGGFCGTDFSVRDVIKRTPCGFIVMSDRAEIYDILRRDKSVVTVKVKEVSLIAVAGADIMACGKAVSCLIANDLQPVVLEYKRGSLHVVVNRSDKGKAISLLHEGLF